MVCYAVPTTVAVVHHFLRKKNPRWKHDHKHTWLNLMFLGAALFGVIDHLWNGELFLIGEKPLMDLLLGISITFAIIAAWGFIVLTEKATVNQKTTA